MGAEAKKNIFDNSERYEIRAYESETSTAKKTLKARLHKIAKHLSPDTQVALIKSRAVFFSGKVFHVSRWRENADGSWGFKEYLGEYPSKEFVTAVHGNAVEFTG